MQKLCLLRYYVLFQMFYLNLEQELHFQEEKLPQMVNVSSFLKCTSMHPCSQALLVPKSTDRKSTRLNSSHVAISYAVFCLKKKKKNTQNNDKQTVGNI